MFSASPAAFDRTAVVGGMDQIPHLIILDEMSFAKVPVVG
jgi:hypothetical protein